ncbi:MAG: MBL fold metallo-hydrolase [Clostridia bacterium]|nr:MBL fold metallo-hydrolase [Clostridia bacterium]
MTFCPLFSGSSGNSTYIATEKTALLVDAGMSARTIAKALRMVGGDPAALSGILITHEHSDHVRGIAQLCKQFAVPIYANRATFEAMGETARLLPTNLARVFETGHEFYIGEIAVRPFATPHDAAQSVGYALFARGRKACVMTDIGYMPKALLEEAAGADVMLIESNHDVALLREGKYPAALKQRILSRRGHLSNPDAGAAVCALAHTGVRRFYLGHLSRENNREELALNTVCTALENNGFRPGHDVGVTVAHRDGPTELVRV